MSDQFENKLDFSVLFSEIENWTFNYDNHHKALKTDELTKLLVKVSLKMEAKSLAGASGDDKKTTRSAIIFLMSNKSYFSIQDFLNVLDLSSIAFSELMMACHTSCFQNLINEVKRIDENIKHKKSMMNDSRVKQAQEHVNMASNNNSSSPAANFYGSNIPSYYSSNSSNSSNNQSEHYEEQETVMNVKNLPNNAFASRSNNPGNDPNTSGSKEIWKAINSLATSTENIKLSGKAIGKLPPVFNAVKHGTYRSYSQTEFAQWAEAQRLNQKDRTVFFCHAFEKKIHKDYVHRLSRNEHDNPAFERVEHLLEIVIRDLQISEESMRELKQKFESFRVDIKKSLDEEFIRVYNLREAAYPTENEFSRVDFSKYQFIYGLDINNLMHNTISNQSHNPTWKQCTGFFGISTILREIEHTFNRRKAKPHLTSNGPTNPPTKQTDMEVDNLEIMGRFRNFLNNIGSRGRGRGRGKSPSSKSLSERECRIPSCKKVFKPRLPYHSCCSGTCAEAWKEMKKSQANNNIDKTSNKEMNNYQGGGESNSLEEDLQVSKKKYIFSGLAHITPTHIYKPLSNNPSVVDDALYDTGASVTVCTEELLERLELKDKIEYKNDDEPILGADKTPMEGCIGSLELEIAIEDTLKRFTDTFVQRFLVFKNLNHDLILGRDAMRSGTRMVVTWHDLEIILIDPTINMIKQINAQKRDKIRVANNIKRMQVLKSLQEPTSSSKVSVIPKIDNSQPPVQNSQDKVKVDSQNYSFRAPGLVLNGEKFEKYQDIVEKMTCNFMEQAQSYDDSEDTDDSALKDVITTGGFDGLLEKNNITVTDTKMVKTKKGSFKVGAQLSEKTTKKFIKFINEFRGKVFDTTELGEMKIEAHPELKSGAKKHSGPPRYMPLNPFMQKEAKVLVEKMVKLGVLVETTKIANSTIFIVQKASGKWRLICDLRRFNETLEDYVVHLPSPYELINRICENKLFSYFDYPEAYFNMPLSQESIKDNPIVASVSGLQTNFQYMRLPQGMKTSTSVFINALGVIYQPIQDFTFNFLDDCVIGSSESEDDHFEKFVKFVNITNDAGLKLSPAKSAYFCKDISFLNYTISDGHWALSEKQKATINALNADKLTKEKRESMAAFLQHYNRFTTGVAHAARKIRDCSMPEQQVSSILENVKRKLLDSPALKSANFKDPLHIYCDASDLDVAGVIYQKSKEGKFNLVTCFSKKLPKSMINKSIYSKELWCLQQICLTFRYLFIGDHKKIFYCDNKAALAAERSRAPSLNCLFEYIKTTFSNVVFKYVETKKNPSDIFTRQIKSADEGAAPEANNVASRTRARVTATMSEALKNKILKVHANAGCISANKILLTLQGIGYNNLKLKDVESALTACDLCKDVRNHIRPRRSAPGITISKEDSCQSSIYIDHKMVLTGARRDRILENNEDPNFTLDDEKQSILTVFEPVSSLVAFYPVSSYSTDEVKRALRIWMSTNGPPENVISDNAASFTALKPWLEKFDSKLHTTSVYHPQSNLSERAHAEFERCLKVYDTRCNEYKFENWEDHLAQAVVTTNALRHSKFKISPFEVFKNRIQSNILPLKFYPVPMEQKLLSEKFNSKVDVVVSSSLKVILPVFRKGQEVKVMFPDQEPRFGVVTATKDYNTRMAVRVKFGNERSVSVAKNFICIPKNSQADDSPVLPDPDQTENDQVNDQTPQA